MGIGWKGTLLIGLLLVGLAVGGWIARQNNPRAAANDSRREVVFWHFWGGADREVVDDVVNRFNESQTEFRVRAVAMPGNNLQAKLFLSIAGGDPPDLVNQDDPVIGEWASRGFILPLDEIATAKDVQRVDSFLFPAARRLGQFNDRLFAVCNGLDIRALYYNKTSLDKYKLAVPQSIDDLDTIARTVCPPESAYNALKTFGYLPDSRRLWAWGYVFGGSFFDESEMRPTIDDPAIVAAAEWMQRYSKWYGADLINRFRAGDQSLPGKSFPLLPVTDDEMVGRYVVMMDGQWRTRDIAAFAERRKSQLIPAPEFGVCPLPSPTEGRTDAGWVNGNFFVVPRGAKNTDGAVAFMKYWIGLDDPGQAAETCAAGGWIPVSDSVVQHDSFQQFLDEQPLFREFVRLAARPNQFPIPVVPGAPLLKRTVEQTASEIMTNIELSPEAALRKANERLRHTGFER